MELREAQRQLEKAKTANSERSSPDGEGKGSPDPEGDGELSEGQLIMRLKNQGCIYSTCFPSSEENYRVSHLLANLFGLNWMWDAGMFPGSL